MFKEETKGKELDLGILLTPLSPLFLFLSYLVLGGETREGGRGNKEGEKEEPTKVQRSATMYFTAC